MSCQGSAISPLLDEHEAERILAIGMHGVSEAAWFKAGATYVLQAQSANFIERIAPCCNACRYEDHRISPGLIVARDSWRQWSDSNICIPI